jgi:hypothetical protein
MGESSGDLVQQIGYGVVVRAIEQTSNRAQQVTRSRNRRYVQRDGPEIDLKTREVEEDRSKVAVVLNVWLVIWVTVPSAYVAVPLSMPLISSSPVVRSAEADRSLMVPVNVPPPGSVPVDGS